MREFSSDASEGVSVEVLDLVEDNAFDGTSLQQHMAQTRRSIILRPVSSLDGPIEKSRSKTKYPLRSDSGVYYHQ